MQAYSPRQSLEQCFHGAVTAVDARRAMEVALGRRPAPTRPVHVIAAGKGAAGMADALAHWAEASGASLAGGVVVGPVAPSSRHPALKYAAGDHPVPREQSRRAAALIHDYIAQMSPDAEVHVAISGGASALIAGPLPGIAMDDVTKVFDALLGSGLAIDQVNAIRKRVTRWSAGRMALACHPSAVTAWIISDVAGDDVSVVASGPCTADPWHRDDVAQLVRQHDLGGLLPSSFAAALTRETPKPGLPALDGVAVHLVATNAHARRGAADAGQSLGMVQRVNDSLLSGDARQAGRAVAIEAMRAASEWAAQNTALSDEGFGANVRPLLLIWGGETTVALGDDRGRGGRCQELALAAAEMLDVSPHLVTLLAAGTDGRDGPTDAAGAIVDPTTWGAITSAGIDPSVALARHNAYDALDAVGALLRTGSTGTNVTDIVLALVGV